MEGGFMQLSVSRRSLLRLAPFGLPWSRNVATAPLEVPIPDTFPAQPPELVREMVTVAHFDFKRVKELVSARPTLAKAAWDWGFGDWETALGAASHMGNREIAEYLISNGAHPSIFSAAMLGHLDVLKAFITSQPGVERIPGPHSISLLAHAKAGGAGAEPVRKYLESLGDADAPPSAPISDNELSALAGVYVFGVGASQKIEITVAKGQLTFTRVGTVGRTLIHKGDRVFHPIGAAAVQIRFQSAGSSMLLTVYDPDLVLTARRMPAA
jgi:hypothetical protein